MLTDLPGIYTRVSEYREWILNITGTKTPIAISKTGNIFNWFAYNHWDILYYNYIFISIEYSIIPHIWLLYRINDGSYIDNRGAKH